jgi:hypothetical protein
VKKINWLFVFISMALFIIGVHQSFINGLQKSYWIFMFSIAFLFLYWYFKGQADDPSKKIKKP